jgi:hypothetical protein
MAAVDLCSLCPIVAMRRSGCGSGRCLVRHSRRFTLSVTRGCLAALPPREGTGGEGGGRRWGGGGRRWGGGCGTKRQSKPWPDRRMATMGHRVGAGGEGGEQAGGGGGCEG